MKLIDLLENLLFALMTGLLAGLPLLALVLVGFTAFKALVLSNFDATSKAIIFMFFSISLIMTGIYIDIAWNSVNREKTKEEVTKEIREKIIKAKLELIAADVEIEKKDMFSSADALIKLVHKHIKLAKEYLDEVQR
jgi:hypothetical protein